MTNIYWLSYIGNRSTQIIPFQAFIINSISYYTCNPPSLVLDVINSISGILCERCIFPGKLSVVSTVSLYLLFGNLSFFFFKLVFGEYQFICHFLNLLMFAKLSYFVLLLFTIVVERKLFSAEPKMHGIEATLGCRIWDLNDLCIGEGRCWYLGGDKHALYKWRCTYCIATFDSLLYIL